MNTFLPYADSKRCASVLDGLRLNKQCVEVLQILKAKPGAGWFNHPATRMWRPYRPALIQYGIDMCLEWIGRGHETIVLGQLLNLQTSEIIKVPPWMGSPGLHSSHRANLLRKDPVHYGKFGWTETPLDGYFWPRPTYYWRAYEADV